MGQLPDLLLDAPPPFGPADGLLGLRGSILVPGRRLLLVRPLLLLLVLRLLPVVDGRLGRRLLLSALQFELVGLFPHLAALGDARPDLDVHRRPLPLPLLVVGRGPRLPGVGLDRVPVAVDLDDGPVRELRRGDLEAVRQVDLGARARVRPDGYAQVSERALLDGIAAQEQRRGEEDD